MERFSKKRSPFCWIRLKPTKFKIPDWARLFKLRADDAIHQALVVQKADNSIHGINQYPVDSVPCFGIIYSLDSNLSGG